MVHTGGRLAAEMSTQNLNSATMGGTAVGSRSRDKADEFAFQFDIPRAHGSHDVRS